MFKFSRRLADIQGKTYGKSGKINSHDDRNHVQPFATLCANRLITNVIRRKNLEWAFFVIYRLSYVLMVGLLTFLDAVNEE